MSIKYKVISVIVICLLIVAGAVAYLFNLSYQNNIKLVADESLKSSIAAFNNLQEEKVLQMSGLIEWIIDNDTYRQLMAEKDRAKMKAWNEVYFNRFKKEYGITNWTNINPNLTGFFRMMEPTYDDPITRANLKASAKDQDWGIGMDLGKSGFAIRVAYPVYDKGKVGKLVNGNLIGYVELGTSINRFFDAMKDQTGNDYGMIIKKKALDHKKWKLTRENAGQTDNWDEQKDIVLAKNTTSDNSIFNYSGDIEQIPDGGKVLEIITKGDKTYIRSIFPVVTASGKKLAAAFVLRDITPIYNDMKAMQKQAITYIIFLMILISLVMIVMFNSLIIKRLNNMVNIATKVVGGDFNTKITTSSNDEIGKFESLFEQLRVVFVGVVNELSSTQEQLNKKD